VSIAALGLAGALTNASAAGAATYVTAYAGPSTNGFFTEIIHGKSHVNGAMAGLAADRTLLDLGSGFAVLGEFQATHYFFNHPTTTVNAGFGLGYRTDIRPREPMTVEFYVGPSFAIDPLPPVPGNAPGRHKWLNFMSTAVSVGIPDAPGWSVVVRSYHRSGMYGVYVKNVDEGSMLGLGLRYKF